MRLGNRYRIRSNDKFDGRHGTVVEVRYFDDAGCTYPDDAPIFKLVVQTQTGVAFTTCTGRQLSEVPEWAPLIPDDMNGITRIRAYYRAAVGEMKRAVATAPDQACREAAAAMEIALHTLLQGSYNKENGDEDQS